MLFPDGHIMNIIIWTMLIWVFHPKFEINSQYFYGPIYLSGSWHYYRFSALDTWIILNLKFEIINYRSRNNQWFSKTDRLHQLWLHAINVQPHYKPGTLTGTNHEYASNSLKQRYHEDFMYQFQLSEPQF